MPNAAIPSLSYSTGLLNDGVTLQQNELGLRIVVPPLRSWRQLHKGFFVGFATLCILLVGETAMSVRTSGWDSSVIYPFVIFGGGAMLVAFFALRLFRRRLLIDVNAKELIVTELGPVLLGRQLAWPRLAVSEVKVNAVNRKLLIRCPQREMAEFYLGLSPQSAQAVVDCVRAAMFERAYAYTDQPAFPAPLHYTSGKMIEYLALSIAMGFWLTGFIMFVLSVRVGLIFVGIGTLLATITAGYIHGTQEQKFFT